MGRIGDTHGLDSITAMAAGLREGAFDAVSLAEHHLDRIATLNPRLHSFLAVTRERALDEARAADSARVGGPSAGPLHGIPYAAKDLFDVKGVATTAGTRVLARNIAARDSAVVRKLAAAGMVLLGKTHTVQLAYGTVGINSDQGTPLNPWHRVPHVAGGSSSGSAVAVAAGLAPMGLGTDTGGSVRIPAALCGIVGLKTTVGRISRAGVHPLSHTFDSIGPLTRTVEDAALAFRVMQGPDPDDPATLEAEPNDPLPSLRDGVKGMRIAIAETLFWEGVEPEIEAAAREAAATLRSLGARVEGLAMPEVAEAWAQERRALYVAAEGSFHNRELLDKHFDELDPLVTTRMAPGRSLSAVDYLELERRRVDFRARLTRRLEQVDAFLAPTTQIAAPSVADAGSSREAYAAFGLKLHRNSGIGNYFNLCAISVPCGFTSGGLPIGLMIHARPFQEDVVLRVAYAYEQATDWHARHPDLSWAGAATATT
jgi:aspartyl-tRNA(Asn)/glutamyl-tRNA(Gln) amidotransferase subunit A